MSIAEVVRQQAISELLQVKGILKCWPTWQPSYRQLAGATPTAKGLLNELGSNLTQVFRTTGDAGRSQSELSGGGAAWEALICWYLNLCLIGTRTVVVKKKSHMPTPLLDALTLSYGSSQTNTESDLLAVTFPKNETLDDYQGTYKGKGKQQLDELMESLMGSFELCVIQCKTNWNDNAQIPMLWDLVYSSKGFGVKGVAIGRHGHSVHGLSRFAYAFATVPSNPPSEYKQTSMSVLRVSKLSGGNYWGLPRKKGIAGCVSDIFANNFSSSTSSLGQPWLNHLDEHLKRVGSDYSYFNY